MKQPKFLTRAFISGAALAAALITALPAEDAGAVVIEAEDAALVANDGWLESTGAVFSGGEGRVASSGQQIGSTLTLGFVGDFFRVIGGQEPDSRNPVTVSVIIDGADLGTLTTQNSGGGFLFGQTIFETSGLGSGRHTAVLRVDALPVSQPVGRAQVDFFEVQAVPLPAGGVLLIGGLGALLAARRRRTA